MLQTINGFDLLLVIIIVITGFKIYNLTKECESYVGQIMNVSWELQDWKRSSQLLSKELREVRDAEYKDPHLTNPSECDCDDCWIIPTKFNKPTDLDCQFTSQCACKDCVPF